MNWQLLIMLGSYIIIAVREGLVVLIKPMKKEKIRPIRWLFLILIMLWLLVAISLPVIALVLTKNLLCLTLFDTLAPPVYILIRTVGECKKQIGQPA